MTNLPPKRNNLDHSLSSKVALLILLTVILTGLHGLISVILLMIMARLKFGIDPDDKHGVTSGASRLGGLAIIFSLLSGLALNSYLTDGMHHTNLFREPNLIFLFSVLVGLVGFIEDLNQNLSSSLRLLLISLIILAGILLMPEILPIKLELFLYFDGSIKILIAYFFTSTMVVGFINAGNIADGANGLLSLVYLCFFSCLNLIEPSIFYSSLIVSLIVFLIYNIGTGKVFLGDFGAYFLSTLVAFSSLKTYQDYDISVFFFATILIYPCFEITRSLTQRIIVKIPLMSPDNNHLHNKLNTYFLNYGLTAHQANSMTGLFIAFISASLPCYLFVTGDNLSNEIWFGLFVFEFLVLSSIYLILSKINLKKI